MASLSDKDTENIRTGFSEEGEKKVREDLAWT